MSWCLMFLLHPFQPCHGAQGMECVGGSQWAGLDPPWAATSSATVAQSRSTSTAVEPGRWRGRPKVEPKPQKLRHSRVGLETAHEFAKAKVTQVERALEVMGGCDGPAVQAIKSELDKAKAASKKFL